MKRKLTRQMLSLGAALFMLGALAGCEPGAGDGSAAPSGDARSDTGQAVTLPEIQVANPKLRLLAPDANVLSFSEKYLKDHYGITELDVVAVTPQEKRTKFVNSVMSNDYYDIYWDDFAPSLINGGYVQPIEVDMTTELWSQVEESNRQYLWNGKRYYIVPGFARQSMVYYNKAMFDEAGEPYLTELFEKGEWDWNKLLELAKTLTIDSNKDGTPEQYGLGFDEPEHILYTTGKHFVTFMPDGTARNNIQSPEVARAVAYQVELLQSKTMVPSNARQSFGEGSVAMCIGHRWYASGYAKLIKADEVGVAPLPRDPEADKYYTAEEGGGFYVPKGAPNMEGALAACNVFCYVIRSDEYIRGTYENDVENGTWTEELQEAYELNNTLDGGVLRNWGVCNMGEHWGDIWSRPASGEPWETIAAELAPKIDAKIKELYTTA